MQSNVSFHVEFNPYLIIKVIVCRKYCFKIFKFRDPFKLVISDNYACVHFFLPDLWMLNMYFVSPLFFLALIYLCCFLLFYIALSYL